MPNITSLVPGCLHRPNRTIQYISLKVEWFRNCSKLSSRSTKYRLTSNNNTKRNRLKSSVDETDPIVSLDSWWTNRLSRFVFGQRAVNGFFTRSGPKNRHTRQSLVAASLISRLALDTKKCVIRQLGLILNYVIIECLNTANYITARLGFVRGNWPCNEMLSRLSGSE